MCLGSTDGCPVYCPVKCPHGLSCPGGTDQNGCSLPNICWPKNIGIDGNECPVSCPITCADGQTQCSGGFNDNGCPMPDTCIENSGM